ncbi:phage tail assembly chaperone G [Metabacillus litoralis]|uniref:phage tail assembly chaperone G n=1 Tax=Metabacillus litoralis TaxID=152268 RepID=UPI00203EDADB|nr:hypothetical protein [Metabacillus litoralis]MCM3411227.1 hypothetical protein [Metabacillus litoralis]
MKKLTLFINKEEKIFTTPFVSGLVWRKFIELKARTKDLQNLTLEELDNFSSLVVLAFDDQFTLDQFYAGIPHDKVMETIDSLFLPTDESEEGNGKK